ncbi:MAG: hypothetical protein U0793_27845 [Gemmataceae bacterium]
MKTPASTTWKYLAPNPKSAYKQLMQRLAVQCWERLERDLMAALHVDRLEDDAHAASAEHTEQLVIAQPAR